MAITAKKIAARLHLSPSAVSLALSGKPGVSDATRERVLAEAEKLGYTIRKTEITQNIQFIIFLGSQEDVIKETNFYSYVLQALEHRARKLGYHVMVSYYRINDDTARQLSSISSDTVGTVILGTEISASYLTHLQRLFDLKIPMVMVDNYIEEFGIDCVVTDNFRGVYNATKYLLSKGYTNLGYIRSKTEINNFFARRKGFFKAYQEAHIEAPPLLIDVGISSQKAWNDMCQWLDAGNVPCRALIAENDVIAAACTRALKSYGYRIPEDVAIIGFDNMPLCTMVDPPLTAIDVNKKLIGETAMNILHNLIQDKRSSSHPNEGSTTLTLVSTRLVEREST